MRCRIRLSVFSAIFWVLTVSSVSAWGLIYVVQKGDTLSEISKKLIPEKPAWGPRGGMIEILSQNPHIRNPNFIRPGEKIYLQVMTTAEQNKSHERVPAAAVSPPLSDLKSLPEIKLEREAKRLERNPCSLECSNSDTEFQVRGGFALSPYFAFNSITASDRQTQSSATLASNVNAGVDVAYTQSWSEEVSSLAHFKLGQISFEPPTVSTRKIDQGSALITGVGLGVNYNFSKNLHFDTLVDYEKKLFVRSTSTTSVAVDLVGIPSLGFKLSSDMIRKGLFTLGASARWAYNFPAETEAYSVHAGQELSAAIFLTQLLNNQRRVLKTELGFMNRSQNTSALLQNEKMLFFSIQLAAPLGDVFDEGNRP